MLGRVICPTTIVDISKAMGTKETMLCCHESQRNWLRVHHGIDEYVLAMKTFAPQRGTMIGCEAAEGFRQHLGHCFPQNDILKDLLPAEVHCKKE